MKRPGTSNMYIGLGKHMTSAEKLCNRIAYQDQYLYGISRNPGFKEVVEQVYEKEILNSIGHFDINARYIGYDYIIDNDYNVSDNTPVYCDKNGYLKAFIFCTDFDYGHTIWINFVEDEKLWFLRNLED